MTNPDVQVIAWQVKLGNTRVVVTRLDDGTWGIQSDTGNLVFPAVTQAEALQTVSAFVQRVEDSDATRRTADNKKSQAIAFLQAAIQAAEQKLP